MVEVRDGLNQPSQCGLKCEYDDHRVWLIVSSIPYNMLEEPIHFKTRLPLSTLIGPLPFLYLSIARMKTAHGS